MAAEKSIRYKPYCCVGTIGHMSHGKTTLIAAMARVSADNGWMDKREISGIQSVHTSYSTANRHYSHTDCPGLADFETTLIAGRMEMDVAILVVSAVDGIMSQTWLHTLLIRQMGVSQVVVFLNKCDLVNDGVLLDIVEQEVRELLTKCGYNDKATHIVRGSAMKALGGEKGTLADEAILCLFDALDNHVDLPPRPIERPFLVVIEEIITIPGRDIMTCGRIQSGLVRPGDEAQIVGYGPPHCVAVAAIEMFRKPLDEGLPGDNVCISLRGISRDLLKRGQVLSQPGAVKAHQRFTAKIHMLAKNESGQHKPMFNRDALQFFFHVTEVSGNMELQNGVEMVMSGDISEVIVDLDHAIFMEKLTRFFIRRGNRVIGYGVVTQLESEDCASA
jgi:elongation factor Tu